jgi:hypothetical protein
MPVVVEMKNWHVVPAYKFQLVLERGVVLDVFCVILVEVKGRLMSNNHFFARGSGPLHNIKGCHHRGGDSMNRCALIPGNDLVHGLCTPGNSHLFANPVNDLSCSQWCQRSVGVCQLLPQGRACAKNETTTGKIAHPSCSLRGALGYDFLVKARVSWAQTRLPSDIP